jgi:Regulator of chromosome condensation (RCC1) repeat
MPKYVLQLPIKGMDFTRGYMNRALVIVSRITFVFFFLTICFVSTLKVFGASTTVVVWGDNTYRQINLPPNLTNAVAIAQGGLNGLALNNNGTVTAWGDNSVGEATVPSGLSNAVAIAVGFGVSLALTSDGTVLKWGAGYQPPAGLSNVVAIAAAIFHCLALRNDGSVVAWGDFNTYGENNVPSNLSNVIAVAAGEENSVALLNDGHVVVWGNNGYGQTNVPANATNVVAIAAGSDFIMALRWDGRVVAWGGGTSVPNGLSNVVAIAGGVNQGLALKSDGKLVVWGSGAQPPTGLSNVVAISAGSADNAALINDGSPWIERQPLSQTTFSGMDYTFKVLATGKTNLYYQWQFNGTNLVAATNTSLSLTNLHVTDSGNYSVAISNAIGSTVSSNGVFLVVASAPIIITQPDNQVVALRSNVLFTLSSTGSLPLSYQWQFNGTNLLRATNTFLSLTNVQWTNEGNYNVVITNAYGSTTSSNSFLNVVDLAEAVNATNLTWSSSTGWFPAVSEFVTSKQGINTLQG